MKPFTWRAAILKSDLQATTRHVLLTLSCYVNDTGESAYPATKTLANDTGLSERAVITHLKLAQEAGWLKVRKHGFGGQNWARNEYYPSTPSGDFDTEGAERSSAPSSEKALNVVAEGTEGRSKGTERSAKKALKDVQSNSPYELSIELSKEKKRGQAAQPKYSPITDLVNIGVDRQVAEDWLEVRKKKSLPSTKTAVEGVLQRIAEAGISPDAGLRICCERGWAGFNAAWLDGNQPRTSQPRQIRNDRNDRSGAVAAIFGSDEPHAKEFIDVN